ncbi:MAG: type II toxin-antitoxin system HicA family toxin [Muribaculaceae bacterium]|nr:type II toxin-antitoxin system HicA family toxin [Muribaculaceae bacterium]
MKYKQLKAELTAAGCYLLRYGGNHEIWYSPITGKRFPVPSHGSKEVPPSTERYIRINSGVI